jgi:AcrR family transcriptional regulator
MVQERLLDIAVREFGMHGLEGASTRGIAAAAGTAMSSITYHYGSKEGLYLAAADHVAIGMAGRMADLIDVDEGQAGDPAGARAAIHRHLATLLTAMADDGCADWALFIVREQMNPTEAFDRIYDGMMGRMLARLVELVCAATGSRNRQVARIVTVTLIGQVLTVRASRASYLRLLEQSTLTAAVLEDIGAQIAANTDAILDRLAADHRGAR